MELVVSRHATIKRVYMDANATTPPHPKALEAMMDTARDYWGNPSSDYYEGALARNCLDEARFIFARLMGNIAPETIHFTSCGTESNNIALRSIMSRSKKQDVLITSSVEHPSVKRTAASIGCTHIQLRVDQKGYVDQRHLINELQRYGSRVAMVSIIFAQNEIGTLQPIPQLVNIVRHYCPTAVFHTDATQIFGKDYIEPKMLGDIDMLTASAHKFHGPRGVGILYAKPGLVDSQVTPMTGGGQERGCRSGTENIPAIVGAAIALQHAIGNEPAWLKKYKTTISNRNYLLTFLVNNVPGLIVNGDPHRGLYNTLSVSFPKVHGHDLSIYLDEHGVSVGSGSACSKGKPSESLQAVYGNSEKATSIIHNTIRISLTQNTTHEECVYAANQILNGWKKLMVTV